jgi:hypothetical protein
MLFLFLAKQTLDSAHHEFGADFLDGTMVSLRSHFCSAKRVSWQPELRGFSQPPTIYTTDSAPAPLKLHNCVVADRTNWDCTLLTLWIHHT